MRAVKSRPQAPAGMDAPVLMKAPGASAGQVYRRKEPMRPGKAGAFRCGALLAAAFFLGYLPGILSGRNTAGSGSLLASYYMDKQTFSAWGQVFADQYAGAFLQATLVLLFGFCALGIPLLCALFALKGMYLGYCAAAVFAQKGAKGLVIHWLLTCLPDLSVVLLLFSLAACAVPLCRVLLRVTFGTSGHTTPNFGPLGYAKALVLRYIIVLAAGAVCCALGAGSAVFFAAILL